MSMKTLTSMPRPKGVIIFGCVERGQMSATEDQMNRIKRACEFHALPMPTHELTYVEASQFLSALQKRAMSKKAQELKEKRDGTR